MMKKIACVYFTHNHPDIVADVLEHICVPYYEKGIDIIYYDSSDSNETKKVINDYISKGYSNIYYVDMSSCRESGDEKYLYFLKQYGFEKKYDYIWNSKDCVYFKGNTLDNIVKVLQVEDHDIVFTVVENDRWELIIPKVKDVYDDAVEFFSHYGHLTTNWECLIRKSETMLDCIDMDALFEKYNISKFNNFNQTISLFGILNDKTLGNDSFSTRIIRSNNDDRVYSPYQRGSGWRNVVFELWIDKWIKAVWSLPSLYDDHKLDIVKAETGNPIVFGTIDSFFSYRNNNLLTHEVYKNYKSILSTVTDIPLKVIEMIIDNKDEEVMNLQLVLFNESFHKKNYDLSYRIFKINRWFRNIYSNDFYNKLWFCFDIYKSERNRYGNSVLFGKVDSPEEVVEKYEKMQEYISK